MVLLAVEGYLVAKRHEVYRPWNTLPHDGQPSRPDSRPVKKAGPVAISIKESLGPALYNVIENPDRIEVYHLGDHGNQGSMNLWQNGGIWGPIDDRMDGSPPITPTADWVRRLQRILLSDSSYTTKSGFYMAWRRPHIGIAGVRFHLCEEPVDVLIAPARRLLLFASPKGRRYLDLSSSPTGLYLGLLGELFPTDEAIPEYILKNDVQDEDFTAALLRQIERAKHP